MHTTAARFAHLTMTEQEIQESIADWNDSKSRATLAAIEAEAERVLGVEELAQIRASRAKARLAREFRRNAR